MSISQLSFSNKSSPSRQALNRDENYALAVQRAFRELGQTALEKQRAELQLLEDLRLAQRRETEALQRRRAAEVLNAQDLKQQMALRRERVYRDRLEEQLPGIALNYSGYPNLPETPDHLRKQLKSERQRELKALLDLQWSSQLTAKRNTRASDLQQEKLRLDQAQRELEDLEMQKAQKRAHDREELVKAWTEMEKAKSIRERIENMQLKGLNPRMEPMSDFLVKAAGFVSVEKESKPAASFEFEQRNPPVQEKEKALEEETSLNDQSEEVEAKKEPTAPSKGITEKEVHSKSFDLKTQLVRPPVIQEYQAHDTSHHSRIKGPARGVGALGVTRHSGQRTSTVPQQAGDSHRGNGWNFATGEDTEAAVQARSGRSQSQVVQPAVYVVKKFETHRHRSRVLAQSGAHTLRRKV